MIRSTFKDFNFIPGVSKAFTYKVTVPPVNKAIDLTLLKEWLRISASDTSQDSVLNLIIDVVTEQAECITKRDFIERTYLTFRDEFPSELTQGFLIRRSKLQDVLSIKYFKDNILTTFDESPLQKTGFTEENDFSTIFINEDECFPDDADNRPQVIQIEFTAGYGLLATDIPAKLRGALLQHAANFFENRGDCSGDACVKAIPSVSKEIYSQHRIIDFAVTQTIG